MLKLNLTSSVTPNVRIIVSGKPTMPLAGRPQMIERKITDPSSSFPRGERYPIPDFFDYRSKRTEYLAD